MQRKTAFQIIAAGAICLALPFIARFPSVDTFFALGLILVPGGVYGLIRSPGTSQSQGSPETSPRRKFQFDWKVVLGLLFVFGVIAKAFNPDEAEQSAPIQQYAKKDGTFDKRKDDLDELCKDWVFYKAKSYKYEREGQVVKANEARARLTDVNVWLSQYNEGDVSKVCGQYDTPERLAQYMR